MTQFWAAEKIGGKIFVLSAKTVIQLLEQTLGRSFTYKTANGLKQVPVKPSKVISTVLIGYYEMPNMFDICLRGKTLKFLGSDILSHLHDNFWKKWMIYRIKCFWKIYERTCNNQVVCESITHVFCIPLYHSYGWPLTSVTNCRGVIITFFFRQTQLFWYNFFSKFSLRRISNEIGL